MKKSNFISLDSLSLQDFNENSELIPLMTPEDEEKINKELESVRIEQGAVYLKGSNLNETM